MTKERELASQLKTQVLQLQGLPALPGTATDLLRVRNNRSAKIEDLAAIIDHDPSLAAQVLRYARLSAFGYGNRITSIEKAISLVIGFDTALYMALGMCLGRTLRLPVEGALGLYAQWTHALHSATLAQRLTPLLPPLQRPSAGLAYLAGLLHNFGFLVLGHLHPREFGLLNQLATQRNDIPILDIETQLIGVRHDEIGAWLMQAWNLPREIIIAAREHHYPDYDGEHAVYAKLVLITDRLLMRHGIGDTPMDELPASLLGSLGITEAQAQHELERVLSMTPEFSAMATQMAA